MPEPKRRPLDPHVAVFEFDAPLEPFTIQEAEQIAKAAGGLLPPLYQADGLPSFRNDLNMAFSEWVAAARVDSRKIRAKPESERRSQERGGSARHRSDPGEAATSIEAHRQARHGSGSNRSEFTTSQSYGKVMGGFVDFVQSVMRARGYEIGGDAIRELQRETTRRVKDARKRAAAQIKRRKRKGI